MKVDYSNTEKNECPHCGRWNKLSVKWCKCGHPNEDYLARWGDKKVDNKIGLDPKI